MGEAIDAVTDTWIDLKANPLLILFTALLVAIAAGISLIGGVLSLFIPLVGNFFVSPLLGALFAGLIGVIFVAAQDDSSFSLSEYETTLGDAGFDVFVAYVLKQIIYLGLGFGFIALLIVFTFVGAMGSASVDSPSALAVGSLGLVMIVFLFGGLLLAASIAFLLQFVNTAIVVDGDSPTTAFKTSASVVRENLFSATGYTLIRYGLPGAIWFFGVMPLVLLGDFVGGEVGGALTLVGSLLAFIPLAVTWFYVYHTRYYMRIRSKTPD